jgi:hypothetical protein
VSEYVFDGYLAGAHLWMNIKRLWEIFTFKAKTIALELGLAQIQFAFKKRMVCDGKKKSEREPGWKGVFAYHVCFRKHQARTSVVFQKGI